MLEPKRIRDELVTIEKGLKSRSYPSEYLNRFIERDIQWRKLLKEVEDKKCEQKQKTPKSKPTPEQLIELKGYSEDIRKLQEKLLELESKVKEAALLLPNIPHPDVPIGMNENDNVEVRRFKGVQINDFDKKSHDDLLLAHNLVDFDAAAKITGSRFAVMRGLGAKLERALISYMLDVHTNDHGYEEILPPAIVNTASLVGTGQLPKFSDDSFKLSDTDFWLSPTAEVQLTNLFRDSVLDEDSLPIKVTACTPCFRKEAGSYGKDVKGLIRLHQFNKVELVQIVTPEQSEHALEGLLSHAEKILIGLDLPYRVVKLCSGDLGFTSAITYDLEVWMPSQNKYREISSCSNFQDFQSRRAMIRCKSSSDKARYAHTLNGSGLAIGRTLAAVIENNQNQDGTISIPNVLVPYLGIEVIR